MALIVRRERAFQQSESDVQHTPGRKEGEKSSETTYI